MKELRIGLIGTGVIAHDHAANYARMHYVRLIPGDTVVVEIAEGTNEGQIIARMR